MIKYMEMQDPEFPDRLGGLWDMETGAFVPIYEGNRWTGRLRRVSNSQRWCLSSGSDNRNTGKIHFYRCHWGYSCHCWRENCFRCNC